MVFELTPDARARKFCEKIQQEMCSKLIGVATKLLSLFLFDLLKIIFVTND